MKKDRYSTRVVFRMLRGGGSDAECVALFPDLPGTNDPITCLSYVHVGQHGAACIGAGKRHPATPAQYKDLAAEIRRIGYRIKICPTIPRDSRRKRLAALAHDRLAAARADVRAQGPHRGIPKLVRS